MIQGVLFTALITGFIATTVSFFGVEKINTEQNLDASKNIIQSKTTFAQTDKNIVCPQNMKYNPTKGRCEIIIQSNDANSIQQYVTRLSTSQTSNYSQTSSYSNTVNTTISPTATNIATVFVENKNKYTVISTTPLNIANISTIQNSDTLKDSCAQALLQICSNISYECNTRNFLDVWGWLIATKSGNMYSIEQNYDYVNNGGRLRITGDGLLDLSQVPIVNNNISSCNNTNERIIKGQYYYNSLVKRLNCDKYYTVDLNNVNISTSKPCAIRDFIKEKRVNM